MKLHFLPIITTMVTHRQEIHTKWGIREIHQICHLRLGRLSDREGCTRCHDDKTVHHWLPCHELRLYMPFRKPLDLRCLYYYPKWERDSTRHLACVCIIPSYSCSTATWMDEWVLLVFFLLFFVFHFLFFLFLFFFILLGFKQQHRHVLLLVFEYFALNIFNALHFILRSSCSTLLVASAPILRTRCRRYYVLEYAIESPSSYRISTATSNSIVLQLLSRFLKKRLLPLKNNPQSPISHCYCDILTSISSMRVSKNKFRSR